MQYFFPSVLLLSLRYKSGRGLILEHKGGSTWVKISRLLPEDAKITVYIDQKIKKDKHAMQTHGQLFGYDPKVSVHALSVLCF